MAANEKRCESCEFYCNESPGADAGQCRCNAPHPTLKTSMISDKFYSDAMLTWPTVQRTDWCGQYREEKQV